MELGEQIIAAAIENGATLAGIASVEALRSSSSHLIYGQMDDYTGIGTVRDAEILPRDQWFNWPDAAKSVLVIGLAHPEDQPELDWWDGRGTPGNRILINIIAKTSRYIENELKAGTRKLHYYVEKGGVFLKDAAVLAGLGCIGRNNLLVTPECGPRVRLRALFLNVELAPTGPVAFDPCADCKVNCRRVCPEQAMAKQVPVFAALDTTLALPARDGAYDRQTCNVRMEKDLLESGQTPCEAKNPIKYCRKCELVCPVGRKPVVR